MTFRTVLITGIAGSAGSYLAEYLAKEQSHVEVHGIAGFRTSRDNLESVRGRVTVHGADLMDFGSVLAVLNKVRPDGIFHLAAYANVRASFTTPATVLSNNILGTNNLFEAIKLSGLDPVI